MAPSSFDLIDTLSNAQNLGSVANLMMANYNISVALCVILQSACCDLKSQTGYKNGQWEVVVAQLAERSLTIPEDPGSNPVIGNFY